MMSHKIMRGPEREAWEAHRRIIVHSVLQSWSECRDWDAIADRSAGMDALRELIETSNALLEALERDRGDALRDVERLQQLKEPTPRNLVTSIAGLSDQFSALVGPVLQEWGQVTAKEKPALAAATLLQGVIDRSEDTVKMLLQL